MSEPVSRIQILAPERLDAFFEHYNSGQDYKMFREGLGRLLELCSRYLANLPAGTHRVATIMPCHRSFHEIDWCIQENPEPNGFKGKHVINGGLVHHSDAATPTWGIHT
jgi:hypothetical protein